jgi:hypothetical protein
MSYGNASGVASFARTWTRNGVFLDAGESEPGTNPSLTQVDTWLEEVSQIVDIAFANEGFEVPVTAASVLKAIDAKVNAMVADLVHLAHNKGRLFSDRIQESGRSPEAVLESDINSWVRGRVTGFEAMGVPRATNESDQSAFSVQMTRNGAGSSSEEYARPRFLIRR